MLWHFGSVLLLAHLTTATPLVRRWNDFTEKHSWIQIPKGWELFSEAPSDYTFDLRIGLKQNGMEKLIENLMEISDPNHVRYVNPYLSGVFGHSAVSTGMDSTSLNRRRSNLYGPDLSLLKLLKLGLKLTD